MSAAINQRELLAKKGWQGERAGKLWRCVNGRLKTKTCATLADAFLEAGKMDKKVKPKAAPKETAAARAAGKPAAKKAAAKRGPKLISPPAVFTHETAAPLVQQVHPSRLNAEGGTQARAHIDGEKVDDYAERMREGDRFPAVVAFFDGAENWLADGFHRRLAALKAGVILDADVRPGTLRDAILYAIGANAFHGVQRTNADKRRAVEMLLRDPEWVKWSDTVLASHAHVSQAYVSNVRRDLKAQNVLSEPTTRVDKSGKEYDASKMRGKQPAAAAPPPEVQQAFEHAYAGMSAEPAKDAAAAPPRPEPPAATKPAPQAPPEPAAAVVDDPEGFVELPLQIQINVKGGKSGRRGVSISGRAGEGKPVFVTDATFADLEPLPPALVALRSLMAEQFTKSGAAAVAAARKK